MTVVNRIKITPEARVDYKQVSRTAVLPYWDIVREMNEYIDNLAKVGSLTSWGYFRAKYYDLGMDRMLMFFFYRGKLEDGVQIWLLQGICAEEDWSQELEDCGLIRSWLKSSLTPDPNDNYDFVVELRRKKEEEEKYQKEHEAEDEKWK